MVRVRKRVFTPDTAAIRIQSCVRGHLGRKRFKKIKKWTANESYRENFADPEHFNEYRLRSNGAVYIIQKWFRNLKYRRKRRWAKVHRKFVERLKQEKVFRRGIRKSGKYSYSKKDLGDHKIRMQAAATLICRLIRGFLGRRRFERIWRQKVDGAVRIQTMLRKSTVRAKYPHIGVRHRMLQAKRAKWEHNNRNLRMYAKGDAKSDAAAFIPDDVQSETDSDASSAEEEENAQQQHQQQQQHPRRLFVHEHFLRRRPSFLYLHLRLGDAKFMASLHRPATVIQCMYRCFKARNRVSRRRKARNFRHMAVISAWLARVCRWRRKVKAARIIQPVWRRQLQYKRTQQGSAVKIQSAWRTHVARRHFQRLLKMRYFSTLQIVRWGRRILCRRVVRGKLMRLRQLKESGLAGLSCYTTTYTRWLAHYMWLGVKVKNYTSQHELQKVFVANSVNGGMESAKMLKLAKECTGLISDTMTLNQVEIQFTKVKNPLEKRIDYGKFIELCVNLAVLKFMGVDPSKLSAPGATAEDSATATTNAAAATTTANASPNATGVVAAVPDGDAPEKLTLQSFTYAGLRGKAALITRFIAEVMCSVADFKRAVEYLDSKHLSAGAQTRIFVRSNVTTIQRFVRNRFAVRTITADLVRHKAEKVARRRTRAARSIQSCIRGFLGRRMIKRMAQTMYTKFIHGETEREYWTNPRTNTSYWTKPRLLGEFDCGMATRMPKEEERYVISCSSCERVSSTCFCLQCNEPYCTMCYAVSHRNGQRKQHAHLLIDNCVQCEFQAGTRYCASCKDMYCDSCYKFMHRRGRLRFHVMKRNVDACDCCSDLSAQWVETLVPGPDNNFRRSKNWCNRCYRDEKGILPADVVPEKSPTLVRIDFYGKTVAMHKEKHAKERRAAEIAGSFENRKKELQRMKTEKAARFVQRVYRGYRKRSEIAPFLEERRLFMRMRYEEAEERNKLLYKLSALLGTAKALKSDTPLERVMKLYPAYMHQILGISIDNNWTFACRLLTEHEEHLKNMPRSNVISRWGAKLSVAWHQSRHVGAEKRLETATTAYSTAAQALARAQESGALAPRKLEALKASTAKAESDYKAAQKQQSECEKKLEEAQDRLTDRVGPRGIQKLVEDRRKNGLLMPFRITLRRHSRLALVTAWEEDFDKTEEELSEMPPRNPGKWKTYLDKQDFIRIMGVSYRVTAPPPVIGKKKLPARPTSASSDQSSDSEGGGKEKEVKKAAEAKAGADNSGGASGSGGTKKKRRKLTRSDDSLGAGKKKKGTGARPGSAHSDNSEGSGDHSGSEGDTTGSNTAKPTNSNPFGLELEVREPATEDHITLDRPWLLADVYNIEVYKVLPRIFYYRPLFFLRRQWLDSFPVQKTAALAAITLHKYAAFLTWLQSSFDDESEAYASLQAKIQSSQEARDRWLTISRTIVQMSFDFTLRRQVFSILYKFYGTSAKLVKFLRSLLKNAAGGKAETAFEYWKRSMEKVDVLCIMDKGNGRTETLGEFKLDLKAPMDIMREFIRREFRVQLNATVGESFLFFKVDPDTAEEEILLKDNEFKTYSKTFCFEKTDAKTLVTSMAILIIPDPQRGRVVIPEFAEETKENQEEDELQDLLVSTK